MNAAIVADAISKRYVLGKAKAFGVPSVGSRRGRAQREIWALRDVSFSIDPGIILGVIGRNGAGKTTLLKVLARITLPTSGRALVKGRTVSLLELGAGFQKESTGRDSIYLNAALHGIPADVVARRFDEIVSFAELGDHINTPLKRYSSGMYLRLAFAVAVHLEPNVLLADEVLAVGDLAFQERCLRRVEAQAAEEGMAVLFVSHDMGAIRRLCHQVAWIDHGHIIRFGDPDDVVSAYENATWDMLAVEAPSDRARSKDEHGEILDVSLRADSGDSIGAVRVDQDAYVEVVARVDRPARLRFVLAFAVQGAPAFRTAQPSEVEAEEPGLYVGRVRIPAHLLADTEYRIKAGLQVETASSRGNLVLEDALAFNVYDTDERQSARGTYAASLVGVVRPRLEWSVERVERPPGQFQRSSDALIPPRVEQA
jgi:lipopolysaccharide transport system ATP-binding protein